MSSSEEGNILIKTKQSPKMFRYVCSRSLEIEENEINNNNLIDPIWKSEKEWRRKEEEKGKDRRKRRLHSK